jgi:G3E family GTPase
MSVLASENAYNLIPIHIITGFLGSGKTTLLNRLLRQSGMENTVVIVNEFGSVGIDNLLIHASSEDMVMLEGGCLCCTVRGDLLITLEDLLQRRERGEIIRFSQVVIETTGLADPAPILRTLLNDKFIVRHYRLDALITTVDCVHAHTQLREHDQALKQVALAHHLILTKSDLTPPQQVQQLIHQLRHINPVARCYNAQHDALIATELCNSGAYRGSDFDPQGWLRAEAYRTQPDTTTHQHYIRSFCIERDMPLSWQVLDNWLKQLTHLRGKDLLRVKGIAYTCETPLPVVIQGVHHIFQAPVTLATWPNACPRTQIVFITRNIEYAIVNANLDALICSDSPQARCAAAMILL